MSEATLYRDLGFEKPRLWDGGAQRGLAWATLIRERQSSRDKTSH
jgi:hypothetical protein